MVAQYVLVEEVDEKPVIKYCFPTMEELLNSGEFLEYKIYALVPLFEVQHG